MKNGNHEPATHVSSKPLNLMFVIKSLSLSGGGAERVLTTIASALADRGHRVSIVTFDRPGGVDFYQVDANIERRLLAISDADKQAGVVDFARRVSSLRDVLRQHRPDVAIGFMNSAFVPLGLAAIGLDVPVVASEHTPYVHYSRRHFQRLLLRLGSLLYRTITTTSRSVGNTFPQSIARRMTVVANPVSVAPFEEMASGPARRHRILCVGGLRPEKDQSVLIAAFALIAARFPDWDLHFVGDGPLMGALRHQAKELGLESRIMFAGARTELSSEYRGADIFAIPSAYESFGLATAEALAHGIPAIGFADCPGTNEVIHDGINGVLVAGTPRVERLADGLADLIVSPERRATLSKAGPPSIQAFTGDTVVKLWEKILGDIAREADVSATKESFGSSTSFGAGKRSKAERRSQYPDP